MEAAARCRHDGVDSEAGASGIDCWPPRSDGRGKPEDARERPPRADSAGISFRDGFRAGAAPWEAMSELVTTVHHGSLEGTKGAKVCDQRFVNFEALRGRVYRLP